MAICNVAYLSGDWQILDSYTFDLPVDSYVYVETSGNLNLDPYAQAINCISKC